MQNAYNSEGMQMLRRRAAGLNPYDEGAITPQPSAGFEYDQEVPNMRVPQFDIGGPVVNAMSSYIQTEQLQNMDQQVANDTLVSQAQAAMYLSQAGWNEEDTKRLLFDNSVRQTRFEKEMTYLTVQTIEAQRRIDNLEIDNKIKQQVNDYYGRLQESIIALNNSQAGLADKNAALAEVKAKTESFQQRYLSSMTEKNRQEIENLAIEYSKVIAEIGNISKDTEKKDAEIRALTRLNELRSAMITQISKQNNLTDVQIKKLEKEFDYFVIDKSMELFINGAKIPGSVFDAATEPAARMSSIISDLL